MRMNEVIIMLCLSVATVIGVCGIVKYQQRQFEHELELMEKEIDFEKVAKFIIDSDADFVGLNEMRGEGPLSGYTAQTEKLSELTGMPYYFFSEAIMVGGTSPYGNGFLSKIPVLKAEKIFTDEEIDAILDPKSMV